MTIRAPLTACILALALPLGVVEAAGCSGDTTKVDGGAGASDAAIDTITSPCGPLPTPTINCLPGAPMKACSKVGVGLKCDMATRKWTCPMGSAPADECGCNAESNNVEPGDPCPGQGGDASTD